MTCTIETAPHLRLMAADAAALRRDLAAYHALYAPLFQRRELQAQALWYLAGLLSAERRKSVERMVLHQRGADSNAVRTAQLFVGQRRWPDGPLLPRHWEEVAQSLGHAAGVLIVDGRDFRQQGRESVGVARQYCGELGKKANCQAGVFVAYASAAGATLVHRQLYLPRHWVEDVAWGPRRQRCGVPAQIPFQTKPQIAAALVSEVIEAGSLPVRWVTCDEGYGSDTVFLDRLTALGLGYCAEVPHTTRVWPTRPQLCVPPAPVTGRPPTRLQLAPGAPRSQAVKDVAAQLPAGAWQHMQLKEGSQGPLCADFAALRVVASRRAQAGPAVWLLLRRPARTAQLKTYLIQGAADMTMAQLVWLAALRWPIETCFQEGKQLLGLGDYEGRSWIGWHHHMTLCLLAHFFLVRQKLRLKQKPQP